jgi:hypothetical protein
MKSGGAPPHSKTRVRNASLQAPPPFGVRVAAATFAVLGGAVSLKFVGLLLLSALFFGVTDATNAAEESLGTKIKNIFATPTPPPRKHRKRSTKKPTPSPSPTASPKHKKVSPTPSPTATPKTKSKRKKRLPRQQRLPKKARSQVQLKLQALHARRIPAQKRKARRT